MLDTDTKRRIDTARDILVGKVPDPKSQVEQITIALIYKFMDDMDKESVAMGGKASFFTGDYERYAWSKIFDPRLGGFEMLALYSEAIIKLNQNPNIPQLFRDIFKNAFLPYRDPETLKLFLKTINEFSYDHSERLGDAFEYLLSVLGSQGDAGQFRTPRHIIDFMVQVVNPQKHETVLDPACGTAGFLISSYKHILKENTQKYPGDLLTGDEAKKLYSNFKGYDISPDMVRLSLVNLYLHGFAQPQIIEYDTLTSEERWNEYADVIMANPPFMSPKGGIKPHKRFSVQSNRSEVLFVDYIAEHLTPTGRAAVIVPEGIIFQSAGAYKQLRKMLVENYLYAVVSLPAGIFNPYSGVKTSILLMDRQIAKKTDSILFVKIENDGFGLGAQRREQAGSDLPNAVSALAEWKKAINMDKQDGQDKEEKISCISCSSMFNSFLESGLALPVKKVMLAENGEYNLTGDRYRTTQKRGQQKWPLVKLGDVCSFEYGKSLPEKNRISGPYPVMGSNGRTGFHNECLVEGPVIIIGRKGSSGEVVWEEQNCYPIDTTYYIKVDTKRINLKWFYYILKSLDLTKLSGGAGIPGLNRNDAYLKAIPLPPLEVQREIVAEIEGYQKLIDGARQVVDSWKPQIEIDPQWPMVLLEEYIDFVSGLTLSIPECEAENGIPIISMNNILEDGTLVKEGLRFIDIPKKSGIHYLQKGDLLFNWRNGSKHLVGKTGYFDWDGDYVFASFCLGIRPKPQFFDNRYLWYLLNIYRIDGKYQSFMRQNVNGLFNREELKILPIQLPPLAVQQEIVLKLETERNIINKCYELIKIYEDKIKRVIDKVWEE
ncbi:MAG TPA: N-6 DNA methylase [bacterium]|nr:N-6 DNA methylase [bacterium]HPN45967.1 N-6 DNA methylase [bacterium]